MSGNQTAGYDALFEFSEQAISDYVNANLIIEGVLCKLGSGLVAAVADDAGPSAGPADEEDELDLSGLIGDPSDPVPAEVTQAIDAILPRFPCFPEDLSFVTAQFELPTGVIVADGVKTVTVVAGANSIVGDASIELRLVVEITTRSVADGVEVWLDFVDQIEFARAQLHLAGRTVTFEGAEITPALQALFRATVPELLLTPIKTDPGTTDPRVLREADLFVIDDHAAGDRDALAVGFTFGGGTPGTSSSIPRSHVPMGSQAALLLGSPWLCRIVGKTIRDQFGLTEEETSDDGCTFTGNRRVELDGHEADLREITFRVVDGRIELEFRLHVEEGCKEADIIAGIDLALNTSGGQLGLDVHVHDPIVNESTDGWCVLGAILAGALVGGILGGFIGAPGGPVGIVIGVVVGAIVGALVGLLVFALVDFLLDPIGDLPEDIADAIGGVLDDAPGVDLPTIGIVPIEAWIDDVGIGFRTHPGTSFPVRSRGTAVIPNGHGIDLDRAAVMDTAAPGIDLATAPVNWSVQHSLGFMKVTINGTHAALTTLCGAAIGMSNEWELGHLNRLEAERVPLRSNATISPGAVTSWEQATAPATHPSRRVAVVRTNEGRHALVQVVGANKESVTIDYKVWDSSHGACEIVGGFRCLNVGLHEDKKDHSWIMEKREGAAGSGMRFRPLRPHMRSRTGRYRVAHARPADIRGIEWRLDGVPLDPENTAVSVDGRHVEYAFDRTRMELSLTVPDLKSFDAWLEVDVDTGDIPSHAGRCIDWKSRCEHPVYELPPFEVWWAEAYPTLVPVPVEDDPDAPPVVFGAGPDSVVRSNRVAATSA